MLAAWPPVLRSSILACLPGPGTGVMLSMMTFAGVVPLQAAGRAAPEPCEAVTVEVSVVHADQLTGESGGADA